MLGKHTASKFKLVAFQGQAQQQASIPLPGMRAGILTPT
jgi:hypothetical protein